MADNNSNNPKNTNEVSDPGRRNFVKNTGIAVGGVAGGALLGGLFSSRSKNDTNSNTAGDKGSGKEKRYEEARMYFTRIADFAILEQAVDRIFPEDDNGPGAIELGVPYYIDKQLAGPYGSNVGDFRQGPFIGSKAAASDSSLDRGQIFINGLRTMDAESQKRFDTNFVKATEDQQVEIMTDFADDKVEVKGISSKGFFNLLRSTTLEGAYCDPLYGGNRDMKGWKMKEYPGAIASYAHMIEEDKFVKMDQVSLTDYQPK